MGEVKQGSKYTWFHETDEKGAGGAHHEYDVCTGDTPVVILQGIKFQKGPIQEAGVNGVTHEDLIGIVIHRLKCFQEGPYACRENELAQMDLEHALEILNSRTKKREERGVEGTSTI